MLVTLEISDRLENFSLTLYTVGKSQVLIIFDSNWNDDSYIGNFDNAQFASNVIS